MILRNDLPLFKDMSEAFCYKLELEKRKEYQLKGFYHSLRQSCLIIDNDKVDVLLSTWRLKASSKIIDFERYGIGIIETGLHSYVLQISQHKPKGKCKFLEGYKSIPNMEEIEKIIKGIKW